MTSLAAEILKCRFRIKFLNSIWIQSSTLSIFKPQGLRGRKKLLSVNFGNNKETFIKSFCHRDVSQWLRTISIDVSDNKYVFTRFSLEWSLDMTRALDITWLWLQVRGGVPRRHAHHLPALPALGASLGLQLLCGVHWHFPRITQRHQRRGYRDAWRREKTLGHDKSGKF